MTTAGIRNPHSHFRLSLSRRADVYFSNSKANTFTGSLSVLQIVGSIFLSWKKHHRFSHAADSTTIAFGICSPIFTPSINCTNSFKKQVLPESHELVFGRTDAIRLTILRNCFLTKTTEFKLKTHFEQHCTVCARSVGKIVLLVQIRNPIIQAPIQDCNVVHFWGTAKIRKAVHFPTVFLCTPVMT